MDSEKEIKDEETSYDPLVSMEPEELPKQKTTQYGPLIFYLILSGLLILSSIFNSNINHMNLLVNIIWVGIFSFLIYELCNHNRIGLAWFAAFLPSIIAIFVILIICGYRALI